MCAEVTHEGIEARVGQPEMVRGDRPTSLMGEITGKQNVIRAAKSQWVKLPNDCPLLRTELGKTSAISTQITAPVDIPKKAI